MTKSFLITALVIYSLLQVIAWLLLAGNFHARLSRLEAVDQQVVPAVQQLMQRTAPPAAK